MNFINVPRGTMGVMQMRKTFMSLVVIATLLTGCNVEEEEQAIEDKLQEEAGLSEGYIDVSESGRQKEIKHIETGCHFTVVTGIQAIAITQMFVKENGVTAPYCDEE